MIAPVPWLRLGRRLGVAAAIYATIRSGGDSYTWPMLGRHALLCPRPGASRRRRGLIDAGARGYQFRVVWQSSSRPADRGRCRSVTSGDVSLVWPASFAFSGGCVSAAVVQRALRRFTTSADASALRSSSEPFAVSELRPMPSTLRSIGGCDAQREVRESAIESVP
jgi:hypothetical protein